ncbi:hypothetical protein GCM10027271_19560 [Saccharopolyspora gloriosae]|uniref:DUF3558 domain-containing protein n=1 Tax=Saccharopolyspora gloriosae TaxID=455344 RepID=A0A840N786_9PSEU|nr:hypothetical protein [Saccharopolyspora gloriosae]
MKKSSRTVSTTAAGFALLALSSCALGDSGPDGGSGNDAAPPSEAQGTGLADFDPCTFFKPDELTSFGVGTQAEDFTLVSFQPGCSWTGQDLDLVLQKNADETVDSLSKGAWDEFTKIDVAGREAARVVPAGATGQGICNTVVSTGGGVALYQLTAAMRDTLADPCGEIEKIANQTASRLPA